MISWEQDTGKGLGYNEGCLQSDEGCLEADGDALSC